MKTLPVQANRKLRITCTLNYVCWHCFINYFIEQRMPFNQQLVRTGRRTGRRSRHTSLPAISLPSIQWNLNSIKRTEADGLNFYLTTIFIISPSPTFHFYYCSIIHRQIPRSIENNERTKFEKLSK